MFDQLESRLLLTVTFIPRSGLLQIVATDAADDIRLRLSNRRVILEMNDDPARTFARTAVLGILVHGKGGDDAIVLARNITTPATLIGGAGSDTICAGAGNDILRGGFDDDILQPRLGTDELSGGRGIDTADYSDRTAAVVLVLGAAVNSGQQGEADQILADVENANTGSGDDRITGSAAANQIDGGAGNDTLLGGDRNDTLSGGAGHDVLDGQAGADHFNGGDGIDEATFELRSAAVTITTNGLDDDGETDEADNVADDIENLTGGGGDDFIQGGLAANRLTGNGGNDTLEGLEGDDTFFGGAGNDIFSGGDGTDAVDYLDRLVAATGSLQVSIDGNADDGFYVDNAPVESDNVMTDVENVLGTPGDDFILDNPFTDAANFVDGRGGNDFLIGTGGNDTLIGGPGNDVIQGNAGDDELIGGTSDPAFIGDDDGDDNIDGGEGNDFIIGSEGNDTLNGAAGNDTVAGDAGNDEVSGETGQDSLIGGDGDDQLLGGIDNDTLEGFAGNDSLSGSDGDDMLDGGDGDDLAASDFRLEESSNSNADIFGGGAGNDTVMGGAGLDTLNGSIGDDMIDGGDDADNLDGGDGADSINGGAADDTIAGGFGADTLIGDDGDDTFVNAEGNADQVDGSDGDDFAQDDPALTDIVLNVEFIYDPLDDQGGFAAPLIKGITIAAADINGNRLVVTGTAGDDTIIITQTAGQLTVNMNGDIQNFPLAGIQTLDINAGGGNDVVRLSAANGNSPVTRRSTILGGNGNDSLTGGEGRDFIYGQAGDDTVDGAGANDLLSGGFPTFSTGPDGADVLRGGPGSSDDADYSRRRDGVEISIDGDANDGADGEGDFVGSDIENIYGGRGADRIVGSAAANLLSGGAGADTIFGLGGNDTFVGGADSDRAFADAGNDFLYLQDGSPDSFNPGTDSRVFVLRDPGSGVDVQVPDQDP